MENINIKRFGIASGITGATLYLACIIIMALLGSDLLINIANLLFHGIDFTEIIRMNISILESLLGIVVSFVFWGIIGFFLAYIYNKIN